MLKNNIKQIISCFLVFIIFTSFCMNATAEGDSGDSAFTGIISEGVAKKNGEVFNSLYETLDPDVAYSVDLKYDSQGRIVKFIIKHGNIHDNTIVDYANDGTFRFDKTTQENVGSVEMLSIINENVSLRSSIGNYDSKMTDSAVKKRIEEAQIVWNNNETMREAAHIEAEIARADYCVVYPKSTFASLYLEDGNLDNDTYFRRVMRSTSPQMYGSDIMALQRALMAYGYLDSTDVKLEDYGYFGPSTKAAVIDYQTDKGLYVDGEVGNSTIKKLFSAGSVNNKAQVNFDGLNRINAFRTKHNLVCDALISRLSITSNDMLKEAFIIGAGLKGNGGRADVVRKSKPLSSVWEVKPDSAYGRLTGAPQVATYVNRSHDQVNKDTYRAYCPLTYGSNITPFYMPWDGTRQVYVSSYRTDGVNNPGVVYYRDTKGTQPIWQPSPVVVPVPKPNEDYKTITLPEPQTVYNGLLRIGVAIATVVFIKGAIAFAAALPTGGFSFTLLFI